MYSVLQESVSDVVEISAKKVKKKGFVEKIADKFVPKKNQPAQYVDTLIKPVSNEGITAQRNYADELLEQATKQIEDAKYLEEEAKKLALKKQQNSSLGIVKEVVNNTQSNNLGVKKLETIKKEPPVSIKTSVVTNNSVSSSEQKLRQEYSFDMTMSLEEMKELTFRIFRNADQLSRNSEEYKILDKIQKDLSRTICNKNHELASEILSSPKERAFLDDVFSKTILPKVTIDGKTYENITAEQVLNMAYSPMRLPKGKSLYHGTKAENVDGILRDGFKIDCCSTEKHGRGIYFGTNGNQIRKYYAGDSGNVFACEAKDDLNVAHLSTINCSGEDIFSGSDFLGWVVNKIHGKYGEATDNLILLQDYVKLRLQEKGFAGVVTKNRGQTVDYVYSIFDPKNIKITKCE